MECSAKLDVIGRGTAEKVIIETNENVFTDDMGPLTGLWDQANMDQPDIWQCRDKGKGQNKNMLESGLCSEFSAYEGVLEACRGMGSIAQHTLYIGGCHRTGGGHRHAVGGGSSTGKRHVKMVRVVEAWGGCKCAHMHRKSPRVNSGM